MNFEYKPIRLEETRKVKLAQHEFSRTRPWSNAPLNAAVSLIERIVLGIKPEKLEIYESTYQTPTQTNFGENNIGRVRHYKASNDKAVIVLPQSGYGYDLRKIISSYLAMNGISVYEVETPFHGSRRPAKYVSIYGLLKDVDAIKSTYAQAISETRGIIDLVKEKNVGICGVSLGAIYASIVYGIDERLASACLLIGGGNIADMIFDSSEKTVQKLRTELERQGMTRELLRKELEDIEPRKYTNPARSHNVLMINSETDAVVPFRHAHDLAVSWGGAELYTLNMTHKGIIFKIPEALRMMLAHYERTLS